MIGDHTPALYELRSLASQNLLLPDSTRKSNQARRANYPLPSMTVEFVEVMIKNHNDALDFFQREAAHGDDPEMKRWAAKTVDAIKEHLRMALENSASVGVKK